MTKEVVGERGSFSGKDYQDPPPEPLFDATELGKWSFYRAIIAEFIATLLFLYVTVMTVIGYKSQTDPTLHPDQCAGVGILGIAWAFGGMIFILVYCTAGISGGHINPAVTFGLLLARKVTLLRAVMYMVAQCLGAICGVALVKSFQSAYYTRYGGGANSLAAGYSIGTGVAAEIIGTFVLVYTVFSATDPKRSARDSHVPVIKEMTEGGADYSFECVGVPSLASEAFISTRTGSGKTVVVGIDKHLTPISLDSFHLFRGKHVCGSLFGGLKPKIDIPILVEHYLKQELNLDSFITHELNFEEINKAFELFEQGKSIRCILWMDK